MIALMDLRALSNSVVGRLSIVSAGLLVIAVLRLVSNSRKASSSTIPAYAGFTPRLGVGVQMATDAHGFLMKCR